MSKQALDIIIKKFDDIENGLQSQLPNLKDAVNNNNLHHTEIYLNKVRKAVIQKELLRYLIREIGGLED